MSPTVLLFDIDGTLIDTGGAGGRAVLRALAVGGVDTSLRFSFAGMTDRAIVRRFLESALDEVSEAAIDEVLARYIDILKDEVERARRGRLRLHEGVLETLDALEGASQLAVGLGTGNIEAGARIKLSAAGVWHRFRFGGYGCDSEDRAELLAAGAERGAISLGVARRECRVVVIGDTPRDIAAARAIGAECVAVATGSYDVAELTRHGPTAAVASLAHATALGAMLGAIPGAG
jgi:phosphoglycolate phosphatase-like HAD superfamily hydrolase